MKRGKILKNDDFLGHPMFGMSVRTLNMTEKTSENKFRFSNTQILGNRLDFVEKGLERTLKNSQSLKILTVRKR